MNGNEPKEKLLAVRLPQHLLDALDQRLAQVRARTPGVSISRSDLARFAILSALRSRQTLDLGRETRIPTPRPDGPAYTPPRPALPPDTK